MPTHKPTLPAPPQPTRTLFDPFNSSSTGHQRAENRISGSTSWRDSRQHKLTRQHKDRTGGGGPQHVSDLVGAGSENFGRDGRKENGGWEIGAPGLQENGWQDIREMMGNSKKRSTDSIDDTTSTNSTTKTTATKKAHITPAQPPSNSSTKPPPPPQSNNILKPPPPIQPSTPNNEPPLPQIFTSLTIHLNGSTAPIISDHKLKSLIAQHGGTTSISLSRRSVTHVILGSRSSNCGGGLAATKIQKEISRVRGKGVKYVCVEWVLDCVEKGIRVPEAGYEVPVIGGRLGGVGQRSVGTMFERRKEGG